MIKVPIVYGALLGIIFHLFHVRLGETLMDAVSMVGNAAIPTIMIILGMQLAKISVKTLSKGPLTLSLVIKLLLSPAIAWVFTLFFPLEDLLKKNHDRSCRNANCSQYYHVRFTIRNGA